MKNKKILSMLIACGAIFLFLSPALALETAPTLDNEGLEISIENEDSESPDELIIAGELTQHHTTYFKGDQTVILKDHYLSDVIVGGQNITLTPDAIIEGDLIVGGQTINIYGTVKGDIRAGGSDIHLIGATIEKNISLFGAQLITDEDTTILGDVTAYGGTIDFQGAINGNLWTGANDISLNNTILGNVYLDNSDSIKLGEKTNIAGDLNYTSAKTAEINSLAIISGTTNHAPVEITAKTKNSDPIINFGQIFWGFLKLFGLLLVGIVLIYLFPKQFKKTTKAMFDQSGSSFLRGLLLVILSPILLFLLIFTIIGIPFSIIGFIIYGLTVYLSTLFVGLAVGQKIMPQATNLFWPLILGTTIFHIVKLIPFAGGILGFLGIIWAVGAFSIICRCKKSKK